MIGHSHVELAQLLGLFCGWLLCYLYMVVVLDGGNGDLFNLWLLDFNWSAAA